MRDMLEFVKALDSIKNDDVYFKRLQEIEAREKALVEKLRIAESVDAANKMKEEARKLLSETESWAKETEEKYKKRHAELDEVFRQKKREWADKDAETHRKLSEASRERDNVVKDRQGLAEKAEALESERREVDVQLQALKEKQAKVRAWVSKIQSVVAEGV